MKQAWTTLVAAAAKEKGLGSLGPSDFTFEWYEGAGGRGRDPDNIHFGVKFIFDGLVKAGVLLDDTRKYVRSLTHFPINRGAAAPGVLVWIYEADE